VSGQLGATSTMLRLDFNGLLIAKGVRDYLILLSICQTCKYSGRNFLDFLRSGEEDMNRYLTTNEEVTGKRLNPEEKLIL
jgi:hypothetical protein